MRAGEVGTAEGGGSGFWERVYKIRKEMENMATTLFTDPRIL